MRALVYLLWILQQLDHLIICVHGWVSLFSAGQGCAFAHFFTQNHKFLGFIGRVVQIIVTCPFCGVILSSEDDSSEHFYEHYIEISDNKSEEKHKSETQVLQK